MTRSTALHSLDQFFCNTRLEELLEKRKANLLTPGEEVEYTGISELERILTFVNAKLIASRDS